MESLNIPTIGSQIKLMIDLEVEDENGYIDIVKSGSVVTVVGHDVTAYETIESHVDTYGTYPLILEVGDCERYSQTDRSGQSDYTVNGGTHPFELDSEDFKTL
jgi:hypothetical protein